MKEIQISKIEKVQSGIMIIFENKEKLFLNIVALNIIRELSSKSKFSGIHYILIDGNIILPDEQTGID